MKPSKTRWSPASLVLIAGLMLVTWKSYQTSMPSAAMSENPRPATVAASEVPSAAANDLFPSNDTNSAANQNRSAVIARLTTQLRAWADDDDPERREQRTEELETLLEHGSPHGIADRLEIIAALPAELMDFAFGLPSFQQWMLSEPKAAADWMSARPEISEARLLTLIQNWAQKNRAELRQYLSALPEGEWKQKAVTAASYEALPGDPTEAITWAGQISADGPQTGLLKMATVEWAKRDPIDASRWVNQMSTLPLREHLVGSLALGFAETDPALAGNWLLETLGPGEIRTHSFAEITTLWSAHDSVAARAWIGRLSTTLPQTQVTELLSALPSDFGASPAKN